jgi:hypothetical protein
MKVRVEQKLDGRAEALPHVSGGLADGEEFVLVKLIGY